MRIRHSASAFGQRISVESPGQRDNGGRRKDVKSVRTIGSEKKSIIELGETMPKEISRYCFHSRPTADNERVSEILVLDFDSVCSSIIHRSDESLDAATMSVIVNPLLFRVLLFARCWCRTRATAPCSSIRYLARGVCRGSCYR